MLVLVLVLSIWCLRSGVSVVESKLLCFQCTGVGSLGEDLGIPSVAKWRQVLVVLLDRHEGCWSSSGISLSLRHWAQFVRVPAQCSLQGNPAVLLFQGRRPGRETRLVLGSKTAAKHQLSDTALRRGIRSVHTCCFGESTFFNLFSSLENPSSTFDWAVLNFLGMTGAERLQQTPQTSYEEN